MPSSLSDQIESANAYEALMVPSLFGRWTDRVLGAAKIAPDDRVLDMACGTGVLARAVAAYEPSARQISGLDPNPGMLAVARRLAPALDWREGTAESLPFPAGSFEVVVSQFGLMFFDDPRQAIAEVLRVLSPGGRLAIAVWDALEAIPAYATEVALLERVAGRRAADALRAPFVLGNRQALAELFNASGVEAVDVSTQQTQARFPNARVMVEADLRGWLPIMGVVLPEEQIVRILEDAERLLNVYVGPDGAMTFDVSAHIVTGMKPH